MAVLVLPYRFYLHLDFDLWLKQAITLLVIACPCALVISTPVAIYAAIGSFRKGALVKEGIHRSHGSNQSDSLDKTRTITYGTQSFPMFSLNGTSREELLACTAGPNFSLHPLAQAIVTASRAEGFEPHKAEGLKASWERCHCKMFGL
jgi:Cd2+/Zn2+-exporting ATPase